jgi:hypothetical protein
VELQVVPVALVAVVQKIVQQQEALAIPHQHHRLKELMVERLLLVLPKVDPVAVVHLSQEQVVLVPVLQNSVVLAERVLLVQLVDQVSHMLAAEAALLT